MACYSKFNDLIIALLEEGADPNLKDLNKCTPLQVLCKTENHDIIPAFLEAAKLDVDFKSKDSKGQMAFQNCADQEIAMMIRPSEVNLSRIPSATAGTGRDWSFTMLPKMPR